MGSTLRLARTALVRAMRTDDWPAVRAIYALGIATRVATLEQKPPSWREWDASHLPDHRWVAEADGRVVGWAALAYPHRTIPPGVAESSVYVHPRSQRRGIGTVLLRHLVERSEAAGLWTLEARIVEGNVASLRLHVRCGFRVVGTRDRIGRLDGAWRNVLLLERRSTRVGA
ncbi:MAG TPA: GNAT family N-acetyltransferase [Gaiellaceae bacterium]